MMDFMTMIILSVISVISILSVAVGVANRMRIVSKRQPTPNVVSKRRSVPNVVTSSSSSSNAAATLKRISSKSKSPIWQSKQKKTNSVMFCSDMIFVDMTLSHEFEAPELGRPETGKSSSVVLSERKISSFEERVSGSKTTSKPTLMSTSQQVVV